MRILIVHHGVLPGAESERQPITGGALRAWFHGSALQDAGHEVIWLAREQDQPSGFSSSADLARKAASYAPDRVICVQLEDAPALASLGCPLAVDLYAPRLLEAPFEGRLRVEAVNVMRALACADTFIVSNVRQRWHWLGVLALAGVDVREDPTLLVPLVSQPGPRRRVPKELVLVAGGGSWPWQDPRPALDRVLAWMDRRDRGRVVWFGGPPHDVGFEGWSFPKHDRLETPGWVPRAQLLRAYAGATAALDWMSPNPERAMALSFRHADYLGCGLPILTGSNTALADVLQGAGWATDDIEQALDEMADDPNATQKRGKAAKKLARSMFSAENCELPLVEWVVNAQVGARASGALSDAAELAHRAALAESDAAAARRERTTGEAELTEKRAEIARLVEEVHRLNTTVAQLSHAIDEVAGFKREAIAVLGGQAEMDRRTAEELERELAILRGDLAKKNAELFAMDELRGRLEHDLENVRAEVDRLRNRGLFKR